MKFYNFIVAFTIINVAMCSPMTNFMKEWVEPACKCYKCDNLFYLKDGVCKENAEDCGEGFWANADTNTCDKCSENCVTC